MFRSGCAYWPRRKGPFFLAGEFGGWDVGAFDEGEILDELSHLAEVGFDFVRVALPWEAAQPDPARLRTALLDHLVAVLEAAGAAGLSVQLATLGQLGSTLFAPDWLLAREPETAGRPVQARLISNGWEAPWPLANLYENWNLLSGQRYLWLEIAANLASHPALAELDLGAGGLLTVAPPMHRDAPFGWWEQLAEAAASGPTLPLLYSDRAALLTRPGLPPLEEWQEATGALALSLAAPAAGADGRADEAWPRFMLLLARTLAHAPVACSSLGLPAQGQGPLSGGAVPREGEPRGVLYTEGEQARFFSEVLPALHADGVPFVCHAAWADAPPELAATPPYDRDLSLRHAGLLRADGSEKEAVRSWQRFHARVKPEEAGREARMLELDEEEWYARRGEAEYVATLYKRFKNGEL
jgi:hypothetical protein